MWFQEDSDSSSDEEEETEEEDEARRNAIAVIVALKIEERRSRTFSHRLDADGRRRRSRGLCRKVLLNPNESPWQKLYSSGDNQALITVTGFDQEAFQTLLEHFEPLFLQYTPWTGKNDGKTMKLLPRKKKGRPRIIKAHACLGLCLALEFVGFQNLRVQLRPVRTCWLRCSVGLLWLGGAYGTIATS